MAVASTVTTGIFVGPATTAAADDEPRLGVNKVLFQDFPNGNDDIYVVSPDGGGKRRLTDDPAVDASPQASPDRRQIAFASDRSGLMQLYVMDADGSEPHRLGGSDSFEFNPRWYDGGARILFQRVSPTTGFDLWTMAADGSDQHQLTSLPRNEVGANVSPDGGTVVFHSNNGASIDVWTVPLAGGEPTNVTGSVCIEGTDPCVLAFDGQPNWLSDGRLLFISDRSGAQGIWTSLPDGTDARMVIDFPGARAGLPAPSANGQVIVFVSDVHQPGTGRSVYTVRVDGDELTRVTASDDAINPHFAGELSNR